MTAVFPWAPPSVNEMVITWLKPLGDPLGVGMERPSGAVLPYRMVNAVAGKDDKVFLTSTVSVHTFAANMDAAESAAWDTHQRMLELGPPIAAQTPVTISTGTFLVDCVETVQIPTWMDYQDVTIRRFFARYTVNLRFT